MGARRSEPRWAGRGLRRLTLVRVRALAETTGAASGCRAGQALHVWALGRRSGKTTLAALVAMHACLFRPDIAAKVRPGERFYAVAVATNLRQARLFLSAARSIVERSELLADQVESSSEDEIVFSTGGVLTAFPCSSRGGRGWPIAALLMDEAAFFLSETEGPQVAERVLEALVPSTAQFGDLARIILASTPYGTDGLFAATWQRASSGELEDAVSQRATTREMNPTIEAAFFASEEARDPESFRAEYGAEFRGSGGAFLDAERVREAVADRMELLPKQASGWVAGLDPAFAADPFGLALVGREGGRLVLGRVQAWTPRKRWFQREVSFEERREVQDEVLSEVAEVCKRYGARAVTDQHLALEVVSRLRQLGVSVQAVPMTATSRTAAFQELRARLNLGELELYSDQQLLAELGRLRTRYTAESSSVVNPRVGGSHGDLAQALALAVYEMRGAGSAFEIDPDVHVIPMEVASVAA
jgi:transcriptional antiterminator Rof (Rho-off)